MTICPRCNQDMTALHVVYLGKTAEVMCWRCTADELCTNAESKWMGSVD